MATEKIVPEVGSIWENKHGMRIVVGAKGRITWLRTGLPLYNEPNLADWTECSVRAVEETDTINIVPGSIFASRLRAEDLLITSEPTVQTVKIHYHAGPGSGR